MNEATKHETDNTEPLSLAYDRLMDLSRDILDRAREETPPTLIQAVSEAKQKLLEMGEYTLEEVEKAGSFLYRDLHDAAEYIASQERELADWLRLDLLLVEKDLLHTVSSLVDQARLELRHLGKLAAKLGEWHTGEVRGIGTLKCKGCGHLLHFRRTGRIPPCPKCHGTRFQRGS